MVVPPLDSEAIARRLSCYFKTSQLIRMSENGHRLARERFDVKVCADAHVRRLKLPMLTKVRWLGSQQPD